MLYAKYAQNAQCEHANKQQRNLCKTLKKIFH